MKNNKIEKLSSIVTGSDVRWNIWIVMTGTGVEKIEFRHTKKTPASPDLLYVLCRGYGCHCFYFILFVAW